MVGFLIESSKLLVVIAIELDPNEFKNFWHELLFVKFECFKQKNHKFYETIDKVVVEQSVIFTQLTILSLLSQVECCTNRNIAKFEKVCLISFYC